MAERPASSRTRARSRSRSLRFRIIVAYLLFGSVLSMSLSVVIYVASEWYEGVVLEQMLVAEMDDFVTTHQAHPDIAPLTSSRVRSYVHPREQVAERLAPELAALPPGLHKTGPVFSRQFRVAVRDVGELRYHLLFDVSEIEQRERFLILFLLAGVLGATYISVWAGFLLSRRMTEPVTRLARQVEELVPQAPDKIRLAPQYADDEVGALARAFDAYRHTLADFVERERRFTADASHELRTPLTVIQGALELLEQEPQLSDKACLRLERMRRAAMEMQELITAFLFLAREPDRSEIPSEPIPLAALLREVVESQAVWLQGKASAVELRCECDPNAQAYVSPRILSIVLANLVRNAFTYTERGTVTISCRGDEVTVADTGVGMDDEARRRAFERHFRGTSDHATGAGLGLSIVQRLCERQGWQITLDSEPDRGTTVTLRFAPGLTKS